MKLNSTKITALNDGSERGAMITTGHRERINGPRVAVHKIERRVGVEAIEGTDALLARCADLKREGPGGVLVKAKKPAQERRVDLPTIGRRTVEAAAKAGLRGIAVEAGQALLIDRDGVVAAADRLGLFIVGVGTHG